MYARVAYLRKRQMTISVLLTGIRLKNWEVSIWHHSDK
jgi:hypothetical protein